MTTLTETDPVLVVFVSPMNDLRSRLAERTFRSLAGDRYLALSADTGQSPELARFADLVVGMGSEVDEWAPDGSQPLEHWPVPEATTAEVIEPHIRYRVVNLLARLDELIGPRASSHARRMCDTRL